MKQFEIDMTCPKTANVFVPEGFLRYDKMLAKHEAEKNRGSYFERCTCEDGVVRAGLWVPLSWWDGQQERPVLRATNSNAPLAVSAALTDLIRRQTGEKVD